MKETTPMAIFLLGQNVNMGYKYKMRNFPKIILLCLHKEPQPPKTKKAPHHRPQKQSTENPNLKNPIQDPKSKTTTNEQIMRKK